MKTTMIFVPVLFLVMMSCSSSKHLSATYSDDVYHTSAVSQSNTPENVNNHYYNETTKYDNTSSNENVHYQEKSVPAENSGDTYVTNNYYSYDPDYYYDYEYSSRLRRFHRTYIGCGYYDSYYTNLYWYTYNPFDWGVSVYFGFRWWPFYYYYYYPSYYAVGFYYPWYYDPWWGWHPYYYYTGYYGYGYWHGYHHGYWHGYHHGYWDGYYHGNHAYNYYYNSYDGVFYGHRGDGSHSGSRVNGNYNSFIQNYQSIKPNNEVLNRPVFTASSSIGSSRPDMNKKPISIQEEKRPNNSGNLDINNRPGQPNLPSINDGSSRPLQGNERPQINDNDHRKPEQPNFNAQPYENRPDLSIPNNNNLQNRPVLPKPEINEKRPYNQPNISPSDNRDNSRPGTPSNQDNHRHNYNQPQRPQNNSSIEYRKPEQNNYNREVAPQPSRSNENHRPTYNSSPSYSRPSSPSVNPSPSIGSGSGNSRGSSSNSSGSHRR